MGRSKNIKGGGGGEELTTFVPPKVTQKTEIMKERDICKGGQKKRESLSRTACTSRKGRGIRLKEKSTRKSLKHQKKKTKSVRGKDAEPSKGGPRVRV